MLKKLGNIFKSDLPVNTPNTTINQNRIVGGVNFPLILANYTRYEKNANIFRSFIKIDVNKAKELNLSYFKTATINKFENSKYVANKTGYMNLLNENQTLDLNEFISNENLNREFDLIKKDILGRDLNLSEISNKFSIENFASRKSYNYNSGLTLNNLEIAEYQDLFFELAYNTQAYGFPNARGNFEYLKSFTKYDLIVYAMDINDQIIDVKRISNFDTSLIEWNIDKLTYLYDIDDVDFDKLFTVSFSSTIFNNLRRQLFLNITDNFKAVRNDLGISPIDSISIQENLNMIESQNQNIQINQSFQNIDQILLECNEDLTLTSVPVDINYKIFMKIAGRNSYIIKNYINTITNPDAISGRNIQSILNTYLSQTKVYYLNNYNVIKIDLSLLKTALNDDNFDPYFTSIFINDQTDNDFISQCFSTIPVSNNLNDLSLIGTKLKNITITSKNANENNLIFYLRNYSANPLTIKLVFEQDFETYYKTFNIETIYAQTNYEQNLSIQNNTRFNLSNYSNLDIEYSLKIKNFKNTNTNLNRFLTLNYENIFLQELQDGTSQLTENFENNIFVIVKKSIYQEDEHVKDKYYIFNRDIFQNISLSLNVDLNLNLKFKDDVNINSFFFKSFEYDNVDLRKNVKYTFEARIMIIPLGFFITNTEYNTKQRIKELLSINNSQQPIPSQGRIDEFYIILKSINDNKFSDLNQILLYKLYQLYCLKDTQASNEIVLNKKENIKNNVNELSLRQIVNNFSKIGQDKKINIILTFDIISRQSNNNMINLLINDIQNYFETVFFKHNQEYVNSTSIISRFTSAELIRELQNVSIKSTLTSNILEIELTLNVSPELLRFFSLAKNKSENDFAPYQFRFLNQNLYFKLNMPETLSKSIQSNDQTITEVINFKNVVNQYLLIDFYSLLEN